MRPVRTVDDVLVFQTVTNGGPPTGFVNRLGELFPRSEVDGESLELINGIFMRMAIPGRVDGTPRTAFLGISRRGHFRVGEAGQDLEVG